ncbi:heparin lyase I family protein [Actinomycetospora flava]|uniref:Heparin lyase I family protein n=1 Tax=Actinomycetospora flava TaxID=3129232 RepID=A0ABU8MEC6_9PSEU
MSATERMVDRFGRPVPATPVVRLRVDRTPGRVPLLVDGSAVQIPRGADPHREGLAFAASRAARLGRPVRVEMSSPWSVWPLVVHADGAVDDGRSPRPSGGWERPGRRTRRRAATLADATERPRRRPVGLLAFAAALTAALMVGAVGTGVVTLAAPGDPAPAECRDVTLFAVNGSGAGGGQTLGALTDPLVQRVGQRLAVVAVPGPEVGAGEQQAVTALTEQVAAQVAGCPSSRVMLFGYSQGAQVAGDVAARIGAGREAGVPADRILAVGLFGDPARDPNVRTVPGGVTGQGVLPARAGGFGSLAARTIQVCAPEDPVCATAPGATPPALEEAVAAPEHGGYDRLEVAPNTPATQWASESLGRLITSLPASDGPTANPAGAPASSGAPTTSSGAPTPGGSEYETDAPGGSAPGGSEYETGAPAPGTAAPDPAAPGSTAPGGSEYETTAPDGAAPGGATGGSPASTAPGGSEYETTAPDGAAPGSTGTGGTAPRTRAPGDSGYETQAPGGTAPRTTAPETTAPGATELPGSGTGEDPADGGLVPGGGDEYTDTTGGSGRAPATTAAPGAGSGSSTTAPPGGSTGGGYEPGSTAPGGSAGTGSGSQPRSTTPPGSDADTGTGSGSQPRSTTPPGSDDGTGSGSQPRSTIPPDGDAGTSGTGSTCTRGDTGSSSGSGSTPRTTTPPDEPSSTSSPRSTGNSGIGRSGSTAPGADDPATTDSACEQTGTGGTGNADDRTGTSTGGTGSTGSTSTGTGSAGADTGTSTSTGSAGADTSNSTSTGSAGADTGALWALTSGLTGFQDSTGGNVEGGGLNPEEVESPNVPGRQVVKLEVPGGAKRSEVRPEEAQNIREGQRLFFGYSAFLPEDFPVDTQDWQVIWQLHDGGSNTSPPVALEVVDGRLWLANVGDRVRDLGPVQAGRNLAVQMDIEFEIGGGSVSVYREGQQVLQDFRPPRGTMIDSFDYLKTGIYRHTGGPAEPATIFLNDLKIGDSLASVSDLAGSEQGAAATGGNAATTSQGTGTPDVTGGSSADGGTDASNTGAGTGTSTRVRQR